MRTVPYSRSPFKLLVGTSSPRKASNPRRCLGIIPPVESDCLSNGASNFFHGPSPIHEIGDGLDLNSSH